MIYWNLNVHRVGGHESAVEGWSKNLHQLYQTGFSQTTLPQGS
jgi:hypothetical protein